MKKIFVVVLAVCSSLSLSAQDSLKTKYRIEKGTKLITGSLSFGGSGSKSEPLGANELNNIGFWISEQSGFFVTHNLVVGKTLGYSFNYDKNYDYTVNPSQPSVKAYSHAILPGVFLRYYKMFTPKFGLIGQFNTTFGFNFRKTEQNGAVTSNPLAFGLNIGVSPHIVYFFTRRLAMEAGFGSISFNYFQMANLKSYNGGLTVSPNLNFGLAFYLGKGVQPYRKN